MVDTERSAEHVEIRLAGKDGADDVVISGPLSDLSELLDRAERRIREREDNPSS